jgi:hypothetical protein
MLGVSSARIRIAHGRNRSGARCNSPASPWTSLGRRYPAIERRSANTNSPSRNCWPSCASCATGTRPIAKLRFGLRNTPNYAARFIWVRFLTTPPCIASCVGSTRLPSPARLTRSYRCTLQLYTCSLPYCPDPDHRVWRPTAGRVLTFERRAWCWSSYVT